MILFKSAIGDNRFKTNVNNDRCYTQNVLLIDAFSIGTRIDQQENISVPFGLENFIYLNISILYNINFAIPRANIRRIHQANFEEPRSHFKGHS